MSFERLTLDSAADPVIRHIEELILEGVLRPGERLPAERDLAIRLGVSRPILREALQHLEAHGLIAARRGDGTYVSDVVQPMFGDAALWLFKSNNRAKTDYVAFRAGMETLVADHAARRATETDHAILRDIIAQMESARASGDIELEARLDVELHAAISEATHNVLFMHVMRSCYALLTDRVFSIRERLYRIEGAAEALLSQHRDIAAAVMDGDAARAATAARDHVHYVQKQLQAFDDLAEREASAQRRMTRRTERSVAAKPKDSIQKTASNT
jgi:GntR family transcriptional regulator, transcriptional repressor for pyruvate dehydrogenase complex